MNASDLKAKQEESSRNNGHQMQPKRQHQNDFNSFSNLSAHLAVNQSKTIILTNQKQISEATPVDSTASILVNSPLRKSPDVRAKRFHLQKSGLIPPTTAVAGTASDKSLNEFDNTINSSQFGQTTLKNKTTNLIQLDQNSHSRSKVNNHRRKRRNFAENQVSILSLDTALLELQKISDKQSDSNKSRDKKTQEKMQTENFQKMLSMHQGMMRQDSCVDAQALLSHFNNGGDPQLGRDGPGSQEIVEEREDWSEGFGTDESMADENDTETVNNPTSQSKKDGETENSGPRPPASRQTQQAFQNTSYMDGKFNSDQINRTIPTDGDSRDERQETNQKSMAVENLDRSTPSLKIERSSPVVDSNDFPHRHESLQIIKNPSSALQDRRGTTDYKNRWRQTASQELSDEKSIEGDEKSATGSKSSSSRQLQRSVLIVEKDHNNLQLIKSILGQSKINRTHDEKSILIDYFQKLKVFQDLLEGDNESYQHLTGAVEVSYFDEGQDIIVEGDSGDTFYVSLEGQVEVLKAQMIPILSPVRLVDLEDLEDETLKVVEDALVKAYYDAFRQHYKSMHWSGMDVTKLQVALILGIDNDLSLDPIRFAKPLNSARRGLLYQYIQQHEGEQGNPWKDSQGQHCFFVNRTLVYLEPGAGFGELALMSDLKRMTTCRANTSCSMGTLNRKNFSIILRRAQKRKISRQIAMLKQYRLFNELSFLKLQKVFYLLQERDLTRGAQIYRQGEKVHGLYLIREGQIQYRRRMRVPILAAPSSLAAPQWVDSSAIRSKADQSRVETRQVAVFGAYEVIGFEEMLRIRVLEILRAEKTKAIESYDDQKLRHLSQFDLEDDPSNGYYNFSAHVESFSAKVMYLSRENFENFVKFISPEMAKQEVERRNTLLKSQVNTIINVGQEYVNQNSEKPLKISNAIKVKDQAKVVEMEEQKVLREHAALQSMQKSRSRVMTLSKTSQLDQSSQSSKSLVNKFKSKLMLESASSGSNIYLGLDSVTNAARKSSGPRQLSQRSINRPLIIHFNNGSSQTVQPEQRLTSSPWQEYNSAIHSAAMPSEQQKVADQPNISVKDQTNHKSGRSSAKRHSQVDGIAIKNIASFDRRDQLSNVHYSMTGNLNKGYQLTQVQQKSRDQLGMHDARAILQSQSSSLNIEKGLKQQTEQIASPTKHRILQNKGIVTLSGRKRSKDNDEQTHTYLGTRRHSEDEDNGPNQATSIYQSQELQERVPRKDGDSLTFSRQRQSQPITLPSSKQTKSRPNQELQGSSYHGLTRRYSRENEAYGASGSDKTNAIVSKNKPARQSRNAFSNVRSSETAAMHENMKAAFHQKQVPISDFKNRWASNSQSTQQSMYNSLEETDLKVEDFYLGSVNNSTMQTKQKMSQGSRSTNNFTFSKADLVRKLVQKRKNDLVQSYGHISNDRESRKQSISKLIPASIEVSQAYTDDNQAGLTTVEDLVQKNFLKFSNRNSLAGSESDQGSEQQQPAQCKSLINFAKLGGQDQRQIKAMRRAEFNAQERKRQALISQASQMDFQRSKIPLATTSITPREGYSNHAFSQPPRGGQVQRVLTTQPSTDLSSLNKANEDAVNQRLLGLLGEITTSGVSSIKKLISENNTRCYTQADKLIAKETRKKPTLYNEVKTMHHNVTRVGPAYSAIVRQKRRAELMALNQAMPTRVTGSYADSIHSLQQTAAKAKISIKVTSAKSNNLIKLRTSQPSQLKGNRNFIENRYAQEPEPMLINSLSKKSRQHGNAPAHKVAQQKLNGRNVQGRADRALILRQSSQVAPDVSSQYQMSTIQDSIRQNDMKTLELYEADQDQKTGGLIVKQGLLKRRQVTSDQKIQQKPKSLQVRMKTNRQEMPAVQHAEYGTNGNKASEWPPLRASLSSSPLKPKQYESNRQSQTSSRKSQEKAVGADLQVKGTMMTTPEITAELLGVDQSDGGNTMDSEKLALIKMLDQRVEQVIQEARDKEQIGDQYLPGPTNGNTMVNKSDAALMAIAKGIQALSQAPLLPEKAMQGWTTSQNNSVKPGAVSPASRVIYSSKVEQRSEENKVPSSGSDN